MNNLDDRAHTLIHDLIQLTDPEKIQERIQKYLDDGGDIKYCPIPHRMPIINILLAYKNISALELLYKNGADINFIDATGQSTLMMAIDRHIEEAILILLRYNAILVFNFAHITFETAIEFSRNKCCSGCKSTYRMIEILERHSAGQVDAKPVGRRKLSDKEDNAPI